MNLVYIYFSNFTEIMEPLLIHPYNYGILTLAVFKSLAKIAKISVSLNLRYLVALQQIFNLFGYLLRFWYSDSKISIQYSYYIAYGWM